MTKKYLIFLAFFWGGGSMVAACTCVLSLAFGGGKLWDACFVYSGEEGRGDAPFSPPPVSNILLSWAEGGRETKSGKTL